MAGKTPTPLPERIGKYVIKRLLGKGGMGKVYHAYDPLIGRDVALKVMLPDLAEDPVLKERFVREAQSAGRLRHPNIVTIYDLGEEDGVPFIAMEYLEGRDLDEVIRTRVPMPVDEKLEIIRQACEALGYAHGQGVVHRDIKPANIRILEGPVVKIMDFGIAKMGTTHFTQTGIIMGTPHYMAPEQVRGEREKIDGRTDIFALGVVLYEFLVYHRPFEGEHYTTVFYKIVHEPPAPLPTDADIPRLADIWPILEKALAKNPDARYQSAYDMSRDLQAVIRQIRDERTTIVTREESQTVLVSSPPPIPTRPTERPTPPAEPPTVLSPTPPRPPTAPQTPPTPSTPSEISIAVGPPLEARGTPVGLWVALASAFLVLGVAAAYLTYRWWPSGHGPSHPETPPRQPPPPPETRVTGAQSGESPPAETSVPEKTPLPPPPEKTPRGGTPVETPKGDLFINLLPWAEILRIERVPDGHRAPIPTPAYTPLWVRGVPVGRYIVEYWHPLMDAPATVEVEVTDRQAHRLVQRVFPKRLPPELQDIPEP